MKKGRLIVLALGLVAALVVAGAAVLLGPVAPREWRAEPPPGPTLDPDFIRWLEVRRAKQRAQQFKDSQREAREKERRPGRWKKRPVE